MRNLTLALAFLLALLPAAAHATAWGTLQVMAEREWTTEKEPRPRVTKFRWVQPGKVLEARHGFVSRLQFGEAKFADTVQRFVLDPKSDTINVTYTYEDGRPPLKAVIKVQPDGSLIETFTDAKGVKKRNLYKSPAPNVNLIERQEMKGSSWASLGTTRKGGLTQMEIAEISRRKEQERLAAISRENARIAAAAQARRAAEERAYAEQQSYQQEDQPMMGGMNMLDVLNGLGAAVQQQNVQQQQSFDRQMQSYSSGSSSSNGAIVMDNSPAPTYTPPPPSSTAQVPSVQPAPSTSTGAFAQGQSSSGCKTFWHRPNPQNYTYERCSPGDENCTCADSSKVSPQ